MQSLAGRRDFDLSELSVMGLIRRGIAEDIEVSQILFDLPIHVRYIAVKLAVMDPAGLLAEFAQAVRESKQWRKCHKWPTNRFDGVHNSVRALRRFGRVARGSIAASVPSIRQNDQRLA